MAMDQAHEWKATWKDGKTAGVSAPLLSRHRLATQHSEADALEALLAHYPWIVYLGFSFWRKLLVRVWLPTSRNFYPEERTKSVLPPLDRERMPLPSPSQLGVLGRLDKFGARFLPKEFLQERIPLSAGSWDLYRAAPTSDKGPEEYRQTGGLVCGNFFLGLLLADQGEVVKVLVEQLGLDLRDDGWDAEPRIKSSGDTQRFFDLALGAAPTDRVAVYLLRQHAGKMDVHAMGIQEKTPLHWAARSGHREVVALLLDQHGADINAKDDADWTVILYAVMSGQVGMVSMLVERFGASPNSTGAGGFTTLHAAATDGRLEGMALLLEKYGADVNGTNSSGNTALHWAANQGQTEAAALLLSYGADVKIKDKKGDTALHWAASAGRVDTVASLIEDHGADIHDRNVEGMCALIVSARNGQPDVVSLLLDKYDARTDTKDNDDWTPLHYAAHNNMKEVVSLLLTKYGTDINARENDGDSALHFAARAGHADTVAILLEAGADPEVKDNRGSTPLALANFFNQKEIVNVLESFKPVASSNENEGVPARFSGSSA